MNATASETSVSTDWSPDGLWSVRVPVPPIADQIRLVANAETLFSSWAKWESEFSTLKSTYEPFGLRELIQNSLDAVTVICVDAKPARRSLRQLLGRGRRLESPSASDVLNDLHNEVLNAAQLKLRSLDELAKRQLAQFHKLFRLLRLVLVVRLSCYLRKRHRRLINETDFSHDHSQFRLQFLIPVRLSLLTFPEAPRAHSEVFYESHF